MSRIRITIEYDTDGNSVEHEREDWLREAVTFMDIKACGEDDPSVKITFETVEG